MTTHVRDGASAEDLCAGCEAVDAALQADAATAHLAPPWRAFAERAESAAREEVLLGRRRRRARARIAVADARWDAEVDAFGAVLLGVSGGSVGAPPYGHYFERTSIAEAKGAGAERALEIAGPWLDDLEKAAPAPLSTTWRPRLQPVVAALSAAVAEDRSVARAERAAAAALAPLRDEIDQALGGLLEELGRLFPDAPERPAAYVAQSLLMRCDEG